MEIKRLPLLVAMLFLTFIATGEERVHLAPIADGSVSDGQPYDGLPDALFETAQNNVAFRPGAGELRTVIHFNISSAKGLDVRKATLKLILISKEHSAATVVPIEVRAWASVGVLRLGDFHRGTFVSVFDADAAPFDVPVTIDVTDRVRSVLKSPHSYIGFTLRTNADSVTGFDSLEGGEPPELVIVTP